MRIAGVNIPKGATMIFITTDSSGKVANIHTQGSFHIKDAEATAELIMNSDIIAWLLKLGWECAVYKPDEGKYTFIKGYVDS